MTIDILSARQNLEPLVAGLVTGTGVSMGTNEIILYISDYTKEYEIRSRIGETYNGFNLRFVYAGNVQFMPQNGGLTFQ